jgi:hypothetical protein
MRGHSRHPYSVLMIPRISSTLILFTKRTKLEIEQKIQNLINKGLGYIPLKKIPSVSADAMFNLVKNE